MLWYWEVVIPFNFPLCQIEGYDLYSILASCKPFLQFLIWNPTVNQFQSLFGMLLLELQGRGAEERG